MDNLLQKIKIKLTQSP